MSTEPDSLKCCIRLKEMQMYFLLFIDYHLLEKTMLGKLEAGREVGDRG